MRTALLVLLALGLGLLAAGPAAALGVQVGPVGVSCTGLAAGVDATTLPPTVTATPPTCAATLPPPPV